MAKYCEECGQRVKINYKICPKCGVTLRTFKESINQDKRRMYISSYVTLLIGGIFYLTSLLAPVVYFGRTYNGITIESLQIWSFGLVEDYYIYDGIQFYFATLESISVTAFILTCLIILSGVYNLVASFKIRTSLNPKEIRRNGNILAILIGLILSGEAKKYYCISCAVHSHQISQRAKSERKG